MSPASCMRCAAQHDAPSLVELVEPILHSQVETLWGLIIVRSRSGLCGLQVGDLAVRDVDQEVERFVAHHGGQEIALLKGVPDARQWLAHAQWLHQASRVRNVCGVRWARGVRWA